MYPPENRVPTRTATLWLTLAVVAGFGPYVVSGIRTEQVVVYGGILLSAPFGNLFRGMGPRHLMFAVNWSFFALYVIIDGIGVTVLGDFAPGSTLAGMDNYLYPAAVLFMVGRWLAGGYTRTAALDRFCRIFVVMMVLNAGVAAIGLFADISGILGAFWGGAALDGQSVAVLALNNGRLSGIFNQPVEAGVAYSLALFAAVYLYGRSGRGDQPVLLGVLAAALLLGGVLSVSKVFLLCGVPMAAWQAIRLGRPLRRLLVVGGGLSAAAVVAGQAGLANWNGSWMLRMLIPGAGSSGLFAQYTADRFHSVGASARAWGYVLDTRPWLGYGVGGLAVPYDSGWAEAVVVGGLVGVGLLTLMLVLVVLSWWQVRKIRSPEQRRFATSVMVLCLFGTIGLPVFTANRVGLFLVVLLTLLLFADDPVVPGAAETSARGLGLAYVPLQGNGRWDDTRAGRRPPPPGLPRHEPESGQPGNSLVLAP